MKDRIRIRIKSFLIRGDWCPNCPENSGAEPLNNGEESRKYFGIGYRKRLHFTAVKDFVPVPIQVEVA
jgi:hypothetical protein